MKYNFQLQNINDFFSFLIRNILLKEDYFMYMYDDTEGVQRIIKKGIMYREVTTLNPINSMMKFLLLKPQSQD